MTSTAILSPTLLRASDAGFMVRQHANASTSNLSWLSYATYAIQPGVRSDALYHPDEEALLFGQAGTVDVTVCDQRYTLTRYDVLYIPRATAYTVANAATDPAVVIACKAPAEYTHPVYHASWQAVSQDETRIRHLQGKDVYLMFDVSEGADKLLAGYTIYQPFTRAWPPHNHTDQEEIYIFTKGCGGIEVYPTEEQKTFVHSVGEMDAITIPVLNYHPVFSQGEELHFLWCIAGERYWIGDKHQAFMDGADGAITT